MWKDDDGLWTRKGTEENVNGKRQIKYQTLSGKPKKSGKIIKGNEENQIGTNIHSFKRMVESIH